MSSQAQIVIAGSGAMSVGLACHLKLEWWIHGDAEINMAKFDSRRFDKWADPAYTKLKAVEEYEAMYIFLASGKQHLAEPPTLIWQRFPQQCNTNAARHRSQQNNVICASHSQNSCRLTAFS